MPSVSERRSPASACGRPERGYVSIGDYAAIGDGRTVALVARDGSIDWLCFPDVDSASVLAAVLDRDRGGRFSLEPEIPARAQRRYLPDTNVLETTFTTAQGVVTVIDALTLPNHELGPARELVRRVDCVTGQVPMRWRIAPTFGYGALPTRIERRGTIPVATARRDALAVCSWGAGEVQTDATGISGRFAAQASTSALIAVIAAHQEPLVVPSRANVESRLDATVAYWRRWADNRAYDGPWRDSVVRSALALKLLVYAPSGAIAAAATASLPEVIGGERNWDYRFCWVRDSAFTLATLLRLGCGGEAEAFFWWLLHASQLSHPRLQVLYRLDGGERATERTLELDGYRGSRPVRIGNAAAQQTQLDIYGDLLETALIYTDAGRRLDRETARRLADTADLVCHLWHRPDSGIWEVRSRPMHFTHSKIMCWVALDRALRLCEAGHLPSRHVPTWRAERRAIREFIEERCWSPTLGSYTRSAGGQDVDASLLLAVLLGYEGSDPGRMAATVEAVRRELGDGPLLARYGEEDGLRGAEGAFLCCSFWLADALARIGRLDEATALMNELIGLANDVGLYAEECDPRTFEPMGNLPQGLVHLALINAAISIAEASE